MNTEQTSQRDDMGKSLLDLRIRLGLSQKKVCEMLHISRSTLWQWESGKRNMPIQYWELLNFKLGDGSLQ